MPKFFVKDNQISENKITITGQDINHIRNVLRMKTGEELQICNEETGKNYLCKITENRKEVINCIIEKEILESTESNINISLFQGLPKFDKMELIIQKNTEIGVKKIFPVKMERTVVKLDEKSTDKKIERWKKIAEIASKQSMRDIIPEVSNIMNIEILKKMVPEYDVILVAYENEKDNTLKKELEALEKKKKINNIGILIGPEGGISEKEIDELKKANCKFVSLGKRILRTETAGLVMASNIFYELEEE